MPDGQKHYYGVVIRKLLYTRRDRSRGIRDEVTACEPEVVSRERTWPPQPVAQPSRVTGRPFGTKYDNVDRNKAKKVGLGAAEQITLLRDDDARVNSRTYTQGHRQCHRFFLFLVPSRLLATTLYDPSPLPSVLSHLRCSLVSIFLAFRSSFIS